MKALTRTVSRIYAPSGEAVAEVVGDSKDSESTAWLEACAAEGFECTEEDGYELVPVDQFRCVESGEWIDAVEWESE